MPTHADARALLNEWTKSESLRRHARAVAASMAFYAERFGEDAGLWRVTGLLHDMDYERHPSLDEHPFVGVRELERLGYPEEVRTAILGHATYSGVPRESLMAKTLFAVDELSGFVTAVALVRPERLEGMTPKSVAKKLKDRAFAAAVSRDDIRQGAEELGVDLNEHVGHVIEALRREASALGLANEERTEQPPAPPTEPERTEATPEPDPAAPGADQFVLPPDPTPAEAGEPDGAAAATA